MKQKCKISRNKINLDRIQIQILILNLLLAHLKQKQKIKRIQKKKNKKMTLGKNDYMSSIINKHLQIKTLSLWADCP